MIPTLRARGGMALPILGQGTWRMGENDRVRREEADALRVGLDLGATLIDTAEMYGDGGAERVVGEAIRGRRDGTFLVSKVLPHNASRTGTVEAAERSLKRLGTDWIDLYLLHWPGRHPLEETFAGFETLERQGKIRFFGLSNFDLHEMRAAARLQAGARWAANQVLYNLERRGIERSVVPWCRRHDVVVMAYSPLEQGRLERRRALRAVAVRHRVTPSQTALAWTLRDDGIVAIPKAASAGHVRDNVAALGICLTEEDLDELDRAYPRPGRDMPLETL